MVKGSLPNRLALGAYVAFVDLLFSGEAPSLRQYGVRHTVERALDGQEVRVERDRYEDKIENAKRKSPNKPGGANQGLAALDGVGACSGVVTFVPKGRKRS